MNKLDEIVNRLNEFPTLPTIYTKLLDLLGNPHTTVQDVADVISKDQSVVMKILKVVNSSIYGLSQNVTNISQAVLFLGFNEIRNITLTISVLNVFSKVQSSSSSVFSVVELWKHSIAVGVITRQLGSILNINRAEDFFISGVIHDIGKLLFIKLFKDKYFEAVENAMKKKISIRQSEKEIFGITHEFAGGLLADKWSLPISIKKIITLHEAVHDRIDTQVACVNLANSLAIALELGNPGYDLIPQPNPFIWNLLKLPKDNIKTMKNDTISAFNNSINILKL
jgi:HD-like signal output (HDOD) protein